MPVSPSRCIIALLIGRISGYLGSLCPVGRVFFVCGGRFLSWKVQQLITVDAGRMQELADIGINAQRSRFYPSGCGGHKNLGNTWGISQILGREEKPAPLGTAVARA